MKYPLDYEAYGAIYGKKEGAVRAWVRRGKEVLELPPLDDASALVKWWERWMKQSVPDGIDSAARASLKKAAEPEALELESEVIPVEAVEKASELGESVNLEMYVDGDAMESLGRLRSATKLYFDQHKKALSEGDHAAAATWRKDWLAAEEKQRHWEKDINDIMRKRGELVSVAEITSGLVSLSGMMRRNFIAAMLGLCEEVAPELSDAERRKRVKPHIDVCFDRLRDSEFAEALKVA